MFRIVLFAVLLFSVSANTERVYLSADGYKAPFFQVSAMDGSSSKNLADLRGSYVLLNFWAAKDAPSTTADYGVHTFTLQNYIRRTILSLVGQF